MIKRGRRTICILLSMLLTVALAPGIKAETNTFEIGDYFVMGSYNESPIVWRYVAEDENGKLLISDKILCFKTLRYNTWYTSRIRTWLNSSAETAADIEWMAWRYSMDGEILQPAGDANSYHGEGGFLRAENFTDTEKQLMKNVSQWTMLPERSLDTPTLVEAGGSSYYTAKTTDELHGLAVDQIWYYEYRDIQDLPATYHGAMHRVTDRVFLLDELQLYQIWKNFGTVAAVPTEEAEAEKYYPEEEIQPYFLRTPSKTENGGPVVSVASNPRTVFNPFVEETYTEYADHNSNKPLGIRPAFYLNEDAVAVQSGTGSAEDPYRIDARADYIGVEVNGLTLQFDQQPTMENDRILVPMRAIFEKLEAEVDWDQTTRTATATLDGQTVTFSIDNTDALVNGETKQMDVPARLIQDRTLIPLRFLSENLGFTVTWDQDMHTASITK